MSLKIHVVFYYILLTSRSIEQETEVIKLKTVSKSNSSAKKVSSQRLTQQQQQSPVTSVVSQLNSVPSFIEEIRPAHPSFVSCAQAPAAATTITVQPVTIGASATTTVSPVLSLVQASNGQVYLIQQQQQSTTTTASGGNELFHHSPMTILATDNLASSRCDIITYILSLISSSLYGIFLARASIALLVTVIQQKKKKKRCKKVIVS